MNPNFTTFTVRDNIKESSDVHTLYIEPDVPDCPFTAGQFINVFFSESANKAGKAYSLSSAPHEEALTLTIKNIGEFSGKLCASTVDTTFTATLPTGFFAPASGTSTLVLIAGGIGITPFRSIILDALHKNPERSITLLHSARRNEDLIFKDTFEALTRRHASFHTYFFVTGEEVHNARTMPRRIDMHTDIPRYDNTEIEYLICGSIDFTRSFWRSLREIGIPEDYIYTEAFFTH